MEFTMLSTEIRREPRWRKLADHPMARLAYLSLMTSSLVTYTGYFHLPLPIFSHDSMIPKEELRLGLTVLSESGMIEFDDSTEIVRIDGWLNERRTPNSHMNLVGAINSYDQVHLPRDAIMARSVAELTLAVLKKSKKLRVNRANPEKSHKHRAEYVGEMMAFVERCIGDIEGFELALSNLFLSSDPRIQGYFDELVENIPALERCRLIRSRLQEVSGNFTCGKPTVTPISKGSPGCLETLSERSADPHETLRVELECTNTKKNRDIATASPLRCTLDSDLAVRARHG